MMLDMLHDLIQQQVFSDQDQNMLLERQEVICLDLWMNYQATGDHPNVCQDPYCQCHPLIKDNVPTMLPISGDFHAHMPDALGPRG